MRRLSWAVLLLLVVACTTAAAAEHRYVLSEWAVEGPGRVGAGPAAIEVENSGEWSHTLVVTTEAGEVVAASGLIDAASTKTLEVDLSPGAYIFSCRIVAEDDEGGLSDHYEQGMHRKVVVEA